MSDSEGESTSEFPELPSPPTDIDPYVILSIPNTSTAAEVRTAYRRLALQTHPDKVPATERDAAHVKFQQLAFAYAVLSDEARRARYDATGSTSESVFDGDGEGFDWKEFFRQQVKDLVSPEAVERFKLEYQGSFFPSPSPLSEANISIGSDEERAAVLQAYTDSEGSLDVIFERVMVSSVLDDEDRFRTMIQEAIDADEVKAYKAFTKETARSKKQRRQKAEGEKKEAEEYAKELGVWDVLFGEKKQRKADKEAALADAEMQQADEEDGEEEELASKSTAKSNGRGKGKGRTTNPKPEPKAKVNGGKKVKKDDTSALEALIKGRQANRQAGFLANLEAKYGVNGSEVKEKEGMRRKGRGKKAVYEDEDEDADEVPEPTEEEFQAAKKKIEKGTASLAGNKRGEKVAEVESGGQRRSKRAKRT